MLYSLRLVTLKRKCYFDEIFVTGCTRSNFDNSPCGQWQRFRQHDIVVLVHDDVIKWTHFPRYWPFVRGIHQSPVNSPHKGQWRGALMFSLACAWINGWVNNREAGDLMRHRAHYDLTVMWPLWDNGLVISKRVMSKRILRIKFMSCPIKLLLSESQRTPLKIGQYRFR